MAQTKMKVGAFIAGTPIRTAPVKGTPRKHAKKPVQRTLLEKAQADPSRHVHIMGDDESLKFELKRFHIPEQFPLLAIFFGMADKKS